jgi:hypothetical protein
LGVPIGSRNRYDGRAGPVEVFCTFREILTRPKKTDPPDPYGRT